MLIVLPLESPRKANPGEVEVQLVAVLVQPAAPAHLWLWQPAPARCKSACPLGCVCVHMRDA